MTKDQPQRLSALRENISQARGRRAKARRAVAASEKADDQEAVAAAQAELDAAQEDLEHLTGLESLALRRVATLRRAVRRHAREQPRCGSRRSRRSRRAARRFAATCDRTVHGHREAAELTGRSLRAAPVDAPDRGGLIGFLGIAPTPQARRTCSTSSPRCRSTRARPICCGAPAWRRPPSPRTAPSRSKRASQLRFARKALTERSALLCTPSSTAI